MLIHFNINFVIVYYKYTCVEKWLGIFFIGHAKFVGRVNSSSLMHSLRAQASKPDVGSLISFVTWLKAVVMIDNSQWIPSSIGHTTHGYLSRSVLSVRCQNLPGVMQTDRLQLRGYWWIRAAQGYHYHSSHQLCSLRAAWQTHSTHTSQGQNTKGGTNLCLSSQPIRCLPSREVRLSRFFI